MVRERAVSLPHSSSDSRDKAVCSGTEKTPITTEVNDSTHLHLLYFTDFYIQCKATLVSG